MQITTLITSHKSVSPQATYDDVNWPPGCAGYPAWWRGCPGWAGCTAAPRVWGTPGRRASGGPACCRTRTLLARARSDRAGKSSVFSSPRPDQHWAGPAKPQLAQNLQPPPRPLISTNQSLGAKNQPMRAEYTLGHIDVWAERWPLCDPLTRLAMILIFRDWDGRMWNFLLWQVLSWRLANTENYPGNYSLKVSSSK